MIATHTTNILDIRHTSIPKRASYLTLRCDPALRRIRWRRRWPWDQDVMSSRNGMARIALALLFATAGTLHFVFPAFYRAIVPGYLPFPAVLVAVSGFAEIAGGAGLLVPRLRRSAGIGLVLLLLLLLPANVEMLRLARAGGAPPWQELLLWLRLPIQALLAWGVWRSSR